MDLGIYAMSSAATEGAGLTCAQLSAAIGRLEAYLNALRSVDDEATHNARQARRKRDELASRYMLAWAASAR